MAFRPPTSGGVTIDSVSNYSLLSSSASDGDLGVTTVNGAYWKYSQPISMWIPAHWWKESQTIATNTDDENLHLAPTLSRAAITAAGFTETDPDGDKVADVADGVQITRSSSGSVAIHCGQLNTAHNNDRLGIVVRAKQTGTGDISGGSLVVRSIPTNGRRGALSFGAANTANDIGLATTYNSMGSDHAGVLNVNSDYDPVFWEIDMAAYEAASSDDDCTQCWTIDDTIDSRCVKEYSDFTTTGSSPGLVRFWIGQGSTGSVAVLKSASILVL